MGRIFQSMTNVTDHLPNSEEAIRRGEYAVIRSLVRVLEVLTLNMIFHVYDKNLFLLF